MLQASAACCFEKVKFYDISPKKLDNMRMIWYNTYDTAADRLYLLPLK